MITLTFSPQSTGSSVLMRGLFFRICKDRTLRGPDSTVLATYNAHAWQLGLRSYREFHCSEPVYLRVRNKDAGRERLGPYEFVRAAEGGLFVNGQCIGTYSPEWYSANAMPNCWQEVTLLSAAAEAA